MFEFITVRELYELYINDRDQLDGIEYVELQGWIRTNRNSGKVGFLALNDGTYFKNVQVVYLDEIIDNYEEASHISTGSAVKVTGKLKLTPDGKQPFEIEATHLVVEGTCDEDFPLQKKRHSFECHSSCWNLLKSTVPILPLESQRIPDSPAWPQNCSRGKRNSMKCLWK